MPEEVFMPQIDNDPFVPIDQISVTIIFLIVPPDEGPAAIEYLNPIFLPDF